MELGIGLMILDFYGFLGLLLWKNLYIIEELVILMELGVRGKPQVFHQFSMISMISTPARPVATPCAPFPTSSVVPCVTTARSPRAAPTRPSSPRPSLVEAAPCGGTCWTT